jgi:hypothetical protein
MNGGRKYTNNTVPCAAAADDLTTHVQAAATCIYPILSLGHRWTDATDFQSVRPTPPCGG